MGTEITTTAILRARPASQKCHRSCKGWDIFEANHIPPIEVEACDECNSIAQEHGAPTVDDSDVSALPEARRALARRLVPGRGRSRALAKLREAALREHDLLTALYTVHLWAETTLESPEHRLHKAGNAAREALGMEA